jgi:hypothetical protein
MRRITEKAQEHRRKIHQITDHKTKQKHTEKKQQE